jgi:hypothetical protein
VQVESWPFEVEQPIGPHVEAWIDSVRMERRLDDAALLGSRLRVAPDVVEARTGPPGGAEQERIVLRSHVGMRRARSASTAVAGMVGACDGDLTLGQIVGALSTLLDTPPTRSGPSSCLPPGECSSTASCSPLRDLG